MTGTNLAGLAPAADMGYVATTTDGGHSDADVNLTSALTSDGLIDWPLLIDFSSRSLHDLAVVGMAVTADFYGKAAQYLYWNGCSTGGRQGVMEVQMYPGDYNGIMDLSGLQLAQVRRR